MEAKRYGTSGSGERDTSQERKGESKGSLLVLTAFNQMGFLQYWLITLVRDDQFLLSLVCYVIADGGSVEFGHFHLWKVRMALL